MSKTGYDYAKGKLVHQMMSREDWLLYGAAADLYEACEDTLLILKTLRDVIGDCGGVTPLEAKIMDAIAKAKPSP